MNRPTVTRIETNADAHELGIDLADFPADKIWLATWPDRQSWYTEGTDNPPEEARFCATVFNDSEIFSTHEAAHAWLFSRVEIIN